MNAKLKAIRSKKPAELVVIRHGATHHEKTQMGGWEEQGLGSEGKAEARKAAQRIPDDLDLLITSDLARAEETAHIIAKKDDLRVVKDPSLRSWNMGEYSGKDPKEIEPILENLASKHPNEKTPGGESFNHYKTRFLKGIEAILQKYKGKKVGIVTHSHGTRILRGWEAKGRPADLSIDMKEYKEKPMPNGGVDTL